MALPAELTANAWQSGGALRGAVGPDAVAWTLGAPRVKPPVVHLAPVPLDLNNWRDPRVGWGLVIGASATVAAPLEELRRKRGGAPVFRYDPAPDEPFVLIDERSGAKTEVNAAPRGTQPGELPFYLLIWGPPDTIPWRLQYALQMNRCVGRLDLQGKALDNYVTALVEGWPNQKSDPKRTLLWSVDLDNVTSVMRATVGDALERKFRGDADPAISGGTVRLSAGEATLERFRTALRASPGLIVTTSHGLTGPVTDKKLMSASLGCPVDQEGEVFSASSMMSDGWEADGAIWYAHACCSAGSDSETSFDGLFEAGDPLAAALTGIAALGAKVAPLPRALLGAKRPLRAFIGHVEPTYDWTLEHPVLGSPLTAPLVDSLYQNLYSREPLGRALRDWYDRVGGLASLRQTAQAAFDRGASRETDLLFCQLAGRDVESTVILGDPTVAIA